MAARYWWQCISCGDRPAWLGVCESKSVAAFIRDELAPSGWDQRLLRRTCTCCKRRSLYISYRVVLQQAHLSRLLRAYEKATGRRLHPAA